MRFYLEIVFFWKDLAKIKGLKVTFNIDGLQDTNHLYRRNVKWDRLIANVEAFISAGGKADWRYLIFKHNEQQIDEAKTLSKNLNELLLDKQIFYHIADLNKTNQDVYNSYTGSEEMFS